MKYAGMPMGMWALFAPSFRNQLTAVFGYDDDTAKDITKKARTKSVSYTHLTLPTTPYV